MHGALAPQGVSIQTHRHGVSEQTRYHIFTPKTFTAKMTLWNNFLPKTKIIVKVRVRVRVRIRI